MEPILINRTSTDLKQQLDFLINREFVISYYGYKKAFIFFMGWTIAVLGISTLTDSDILINFKVVLIAVSAIAWVVAIAIIVAIIIKKQKRISWRNSTIKSAFRGDEIIHMTFDTEKLTFTADSYKTEIKWDYYKFYIEHKGSMFFIPADNLYNAISFSNSEIGQNNFNVLNNIAKTKLKPLKDKNGR